MECKFKESCGREYCNLNGCHEFELAPKKSTDDQILHHAKEIERLMASKGWEDRSLKDGYDNITIWFSESEMFVENVCQGIKTKTSKKK